MVENQQLAKDLDDVRKKTDHLHVENPWLYFVDSHLKELQTMIYGEIQVLGDTMRHIYEYMITSHKEIVPLHEM